MPKIRQRKQIYDLLTTVSAGIFDDAGQKACQLLTHTPEYRAAQTIMVFMSMHNEIATSYAIKKAITDHKTVLVPKVVWDVRRLIPLVLDSLESEFHKDRHGLVMPVKQIEYPAEHIDLVLVPGLAFDLAGNRLGRGGGFYDRFFEKPGFHTVRCGYTLERQVVESVPTHDHDIPMDLLITDQQVRRFGRSLAQN